MTVLALCSRHDPVLRKKAKKVSKIDGSIKRIVDDMIDTMKATSGVGLAAPQVGISLRIAVIGLPDEDIIVLINPEVIKKGGERLLTEACLSVPGYCGEIERSLWVKVKATAINGVEFRLKGDDLLAQALEHEIDHLNGILYVDHLDDPSKLQEVPALIEP
ncbi:peptide deformylase [Chloroflexota bacterium]